MILLVFQDMLWRDMLIYKGRIDLDNCVIKALPDDKGTVNIIMSFMQKFYHFIVKPVMRGHLLGCLNYRFYCK